MEDGLRRLKIRIFQTKPRNNPQFFPSLSETCVCRCWEFRKHCLGIWVLADLGKIGFNKSVYLNALGHLKIRVFKTGAPNNPKFPASSENSWTFNSAKFHKNHRQWWFLPEWQKFDFKPRVYVNALWPLKIRIFRTNARNFPQFSPSFGETWV